MPDTHVLAEDASQGHLAVYDAIVIGAGISGLYMLYRLRELGMTARPDLRRSCAGGPFHGSVPAFSALTNPSFAQSRTRAGAAGAYLLGMQSEREWARAVVRDIARRYLASRRECIDRFVDRHFSLTGTLRLYRQAIGWDLLRVPANLLLSPATLTVSVASRIASRLGFCAHGGVARPASAIL